MPLQTIAYASFKAEAERLTNLAVLFSHSVPVLARVLANPAAAAMVPLKPADNFPHDQSNGTVLLQFATGYDQDLARLIVLSVFSYFEAFVRGALAELYELQGGRSAFTRSPRAVLRVTGRATGPIAAAKRRLQTRTTKAGSAIQKSARSSTTLVCVSSRPARSLRRATVEEARPKDRSSFRAPRFPTRFGRHLMSADDRGTPGLLRTFEFETKSPTVRHRS
jgi:hypothetical protein